MWFKLYCQACRSTWWYECRDELQLRMDLHSLVICPKGNHILSLGEGDSIKVEYSTGEGPDDG